MLKATISTIVTRASVKLGTYYTKSEICTKDELVEETVVTCNTLPELITMLSSTIDEFNVESREFVFRSDAYGKEFVVNDMQDDRFYKEPFARNFIRISGKIDDATKVAVKADLWRHK